MEDEPVEGEEDEGDWDGEYEDDDEEDIDAEAQEIARRLEAELWADISKANAAAPAAETSHAPVEPPQTPPNPKEEAAIQTVSAILASLEHDALARSTLAASKMSEFAGDSLLDILQNMASSGKIPRGVAMPISRFLVTLAKSDTLFGSLRHSAAPSLQLKRKREAADENERVNKRQHNHLQTELKESVGIVAQTITTSHPIAPSAIALIQPHLHRVFLFAVSSSATGGPHTNALQEISGLIQVLGVLSGIQIGQTPSPESQNSSTSVFPCTADGCGKFFAQLYHLRSHQGAHSSVRPYRCDLCPATFARERDHKRHKQQHARTTYKCGGCGQFFPTRDDVQRHKMVTTTNQPSPECLNAQIIEAQVPGAPALVEDAEEGEIDAVVISEVQATVMGLHSLLQAHVARTLGAPSGQAPSSSSSTNGQATLASVIAQAQGTQANGATSEALPAAPVTPDSSAQASTPSVSAESLSLHGLSDDQTKLLEEAINNATAAAQAEAEAQEQNKDEDVEDDASDAHPNGSSMPA
ncbi:hypothetical protein C8R43DRAFT_891661 [Mycena crocata]|nr:hypothetical protein C8R43DRAFT_891661 [Mycena crocata]